MSTIPILRLVRSSTAGASPAAILAAIALGLGLGLVMAWAGPDDRPQTPAPRSASAAAARPAWKGVASCSAFACHGGNGPDGDLRSAYTTWMVRDPHSRAGSVLKGDLALDIEDRLAAGPERRSVRADQDLRCLGCHFRPREGRTGVLDGVAADEGVGCESCHGAAEDWLQPHCAKPWKGLSSAAKAARGMNPIRSLRTRAEACARCHVGGAWGDVNHDLIAAGHPRLNFEFLAYLDAMPAHWDAAAERRASTAFDAEAWAIGQAVTAGEALGLLADRARAARPSPAQAAGKPSHQGSWPELAEYACASCHRDLSAGLPPATGGATDGRRGRPPWGTWYFPLTAALIDPAGRPQGEGDGDPLAGLRRRMDGPDPRPGDVERLALEARRGLERRFAVDRLAPPFDLETVLGLLGRSTEPSAGLDRDRQVQVVLALDALGRSLEALGRPPSPEMRDALETMRRLVEIPFATTTGGPPATRTPAEFDEALRRYRLGVVRLDPAGPTRGNPSSRDSR